MHSFCGSVVRGTRDKKGRGRASVTGYALLLKLSPTTSRASLSIISI